MAPFSFFLETDNFNSNKKTSWSHILMVMTTIDLERGLFPFVSILILERQFLTSKTALSPKSPSKLIIESTFDGYRRFKRLLIISLNLSSFEIASGLSLLTSNSVGSDSFLTSWFFFRLKYFEGSLKSKDSCVWSCFCLPPTTRWLSTATFSSFSSSIGVGGRANGIPE